MRGTIPSNVIGLWIVLIVVSCSSIVFAAVVAWSRRSRPLSPLLTALGCCLALLLTALWVLGQLSVGWFVAPFTVVTWGVVSAGWRDVRRFSFSGLLHRSALAMLVCAVLFLASFVLRLSALIAGA